MVSRSVLVTCFACSAPAAVTPPRSNIETPSPDAAVIGVPVNALVDADCRALASARALAIATVSSVTSDCSGVGHERIVFDVSQLARGEQITRVVTSRPLDGAGRERIAVGEIFLVAIEPELKPAATVHCVAIPAHEGTVRHLVRADSRADAERMLEAARHCR